MKRFGCLLAALLILFPMAARAHEPLDWMDDVQIDVTDSNGQSPIEPPFACIRMFTEDGVRLAFFALDERCLETFATDKKLASEELQKAVGSIGVSYTLGEKDEYGFYVYDYSAPESLVRFAERRCGYRRATQRSRTDPLIVAHLEWRDTYPSPTTLAVQTITDPDRLAALQAVFKGGVLSGEGNCPHTGVLTLVYKDGTAERMYKATDSCDGIIVGSATPVALGEEGNERFWSVFDEVRDALRR